MRVEINERLVRRNRSFAQYAFVISMGIWLFGLFVTMRPLLGDRFASDNLAWLDVLPTFVLPIGLIVALYAVRMTNTWVREPRPEHVIRNGLKGISTKSVLYHYYHLPCKHLLISPQGIFVLVTLYQSGRIHINGRKWKQVRGFMGRFLGLMRMDGLGFPYDQAVFAMESVQKALKPIAPNCEIKPIVVFLSTQVELDEQNNALPIVFADEHHPKSLKNYLRSFPTAKNGNLPLTVEQIAQLDDQILKKQAR